MTVFIDTSAFLAILDANDSMHLPATKTWKRLIDDREPLLTTSYVIVETAALVQSRLGMPAAHAFHEIIVPLLEIEWVDHSLHSNAASALLTANRRNLSLVDCASFESMRRLGLTNAFAFDRHFAEQGFSLIP